MGKAKFYFTLFVTATLLTFRKKHTMEITISQ